MKPNQVEYNPVRCLSDEVKRFKATNRFTPMQVTGFYIQAAVVLDYLRELEETLDQLTQCAEYVCAHRYGERDPVGTRIVAVSDLNGAVRRARNMHRWPNEKLKRGGD